jgi:hypothetical protein
VAPVKEEDVSRKMSRTCSRTTTSHYDPMEVAELMREDSLARALVISEQEDC